MLTIPVGRVMEAAAVIAVITLISLRLKFLDRKGLAASVIVGFLVYAFGGRIYFAALFLFFIVSSVATVYRVRRVRLDYVEKSWERGWRNVAANGLTASLTAVISSFYASCNPMVLASYLGAIGTSFADTLATEIGLLSPRNPRLITSMKGTQPGTPGAVSTYGYMGSILALTALTPFPILCGRQDLIPILFISGLIGVTADSLLGATIQAQYRCNSCGKIVETQTHCGVGTEHVKGLKIIDTHMVNLVSTVIGALAAALLTLLLQKI